MIALVTVPAIMALGFLAGKAANSGYGNPWFDALNKPAAMPPGWAFGTAWAILYALMGIAIARIVASPPTPERRNAIALFLLQLILNLAWTPLFFGAQQIFGGLALIIAVLIAAIATTLAFGKVDRVAAWLMVPYLAWLSFATILNFQILQLNQ
jgi:tryptophan-rich sensory protein